MAASASAAASSIRLHEPFCPRQGPVCDNALAPTVSAADAFFWADTSGHTSSDLASLSFVPATPLSLFDCFPHAFSAAAPDTRPPSVDPSALEQVDWGALMDLPAASMSLPMPSVASPSGVPSTTGVSPGSTLFPFLDLPVASNTALTPASSSSSAATDMLPGLALRHPAPAPVPPDDVLVKRQRNSLAARKYRQKKIDRISELEAEVGQLQEERDALRLQLARQEAETAALRALLVDGAGGKRRKKRQR